MAITIAGYSFDGPYSNTSSLERRAGVYAILCQTEGSYGVLDVGESEEIRTRVESHERTECWIRSCSGYVRYAVRYTPSLYQGSRLEIERRIRKALDPPCGKQ